MNADIAAIETEMDVVSADGRQLGIVERVLASELHVAQRTGARALPLAFIGDVDDKVRLVVTEAEARSRWRDAG